MSKTMLIVLASILLLMFSTSIGYSMWSQRLRINASIHIASGDDPFIGSYKGFICCETTGCCHHGNCSSGSNKVNTTISTVEDNSLEVNCHHCNHTGNDCNCRGIEDQQMKLINNDTVLLLVDLECGGHCHCNSNYNDTGTLCHHCHGNGEVNMSLWIGLVVKYEGEVPVRLRDVSITVSGGYDEIHVRYYAYGPFTTSFQQVWGNIDPCTLPFTGYNNNLVLDGGEKTILWINVRLSNTTTISSITITPVFENWNQ